MILEQKKQLLKVDLGEGRIRDQREVGETVLERERGESEKGDGDQ